MFHVHSSDLTCTLSDLMNTVKWRLCSANIRTKILPLSLPQADNVFFYHREFMTHRMSVTYAITPVSLSFHHSHKVLSFMIWHWRKKQPKKKKKLTLTKAGTFHWNYRILSDTNILISHDLPDIMASQKFVTFFDTLILAKVHLTHCTGIITSCWCHVQRNAENMHTHSEAINLEISDQQKEM